jgi:hypothetical protein
MKDKLEDKAIRLYYMQQTPWLLGKHVANNGYRFVGRVLRNARRKKAQQLAHDKVLLEIGKKHFEKQA